MPRRLPPLNALRAFEAAGRHLSFTRAADELNVTAAAISHQVKALEDFLGVALFRRLPRGLLLTEAGQACLPGLSDGFDGLAEAVERARGTETRGVLTVSAPPSLAGKWLVPRLERFREAHPDIDIRVSASMDLVDFARDDVDVALRFGPGRYPGLRADLLMGEEVFPVCSPALIDGPHPLRTPDDLRWQTLIHDDSGTSDETFPDWRMWLRAAGVTGVDAGRGPRFSPSSMAIQAAVEGQGVILGRGVLVAADLAAGRLVKPFELTFPVAFSYSLVCPEATAERPKIVAFRNWMLAEAGREA
jgi:LysR family glycine cleavage system transcriptional activator